MCKFTERMVALFYPFGSPWGYLLSLHFALTLFATRRKTLLVLTLTTLLMPSGHPALNVADEDFWKIGMLLISM